VIQHVLNHVMSSANCFQSPALAFLTYAKGFGSQSTSAVTVDIFGCSISFNLVIDGSLFSNTGTYNRRISRPQLRLSHFALQVS
jgi:hypothetical protein